MTSTETPAARDRRNPCQLCDESPCIGGQGRGTCDEDSRAYEREFGSLRSDLGPVSYA